VIIAIVHASLDSLRFLTDATGLDEILVSGLPKGHVLGRRERGRNGYAIRGPVMGAEGKLQFGFCFGHVT
jgi:hypothetical protein